MGIVFEARQRRLDRRVAIKILRPELATAIAAERFLAEGRILARLSHPNIVPIYDAGEADGLLYYVMEFVEGESLADRLRRGPLPPAEALRLGQDLLRALGAAHAQGVVHRDVKPANIFLRQGQALLGDFGIARWRQEHDAGLTTPGELIGTPRYMSPEQRDGVPVTMRTDVYAVGLVLWEACTGRRWPAYQAPETADWRQVPAALVSPLRRALALDPSERWSDAGELLQALGQSRRRPRWSLVGIGAVLAAIVGWLVLRPAGPVSAPRGAVTIAVETFRSESPGVSASLGDSVSAMLRRSLEYPDFNVLPLGRPPDSALVRVSGSFGEAAGKIRIRARWAAGTASDTVSVEGARAELGAVAEALSFKVVRSLWQRDSLADVWLPVDALPSNEQGFDQWLRAEQYLAQARWEEAFDAFRSAEAADPACYLCSFRLLDIERWLGQGHDSTRLARLRAGIGRFPSHYQRLIHAALAPLPARLDTLAQAAKAGDFFLASFEYGDELFHRGPLHSFPRIAAQEPLERAVLLRPRFGPGWEHLTWLLLSEGNANSAGAALDSLLLLPPGPAGGFSAGMRVLLSLGYHWRFLPADSAKTFSLAVLSDPALARSKDAAAGGRLMMTADAPRGAVELGGLITRAWPGRAEPVREGLLGQLFGYTALGRLDSMRVTRARLEQVSSDVSLPLLALELEATLLTFDPDPAVRRAPADLLAALDAYSVPGTAHSALKTRAALASGLLAVRSGDPARGKAAATALSRGPKSFGAILHAAVLGEQGDARGALAALPSLPPLEEAPKHEAPLADAMIRLLRAEQFERLKEFESARNTLLWHEHLQTVGHGTGDPTPGEMAWALGTLVRWHLANLKGTTSRERCSAYRAVARHWKDGGPPFKSRADSARQFTAQHCPP